MKKFVVKIAHGDTITEKTSRDILVTAESEPVAVDIAKTLCRRVSVDFRKWEPEYVAAIKSIEYRTTGKSYLRFGEIPENEQSINWMSMSFRQQEDYIYDLNYNGGNRLAALKKSVPEHYLNKLELGVSVFELNEKTGTPIFNNEQQVKDFHGYTEENRVAYIVTGDELMERGYDNEPLLHNIHIIRTLNADELASFDSIEK